MTAASGSDKPPQGINYRRVVLGLIGLPVFFALLMFLPAGTWAWPRGWLFVLILVAVISAVFLVLQRANPEVIVARSRFHEGTKSWDKILLCLYFPAISAVVLVAALDDSRFHWFPVPWRVCGVVAGRIERVQGIRKEGSVQADSGRMVTTKDGWIAYGIAARTTAAYAARRRSKQERLRRTSP